MNMLEKLDMLMREKGINKNQLAAQAEIPKTTVYGWYTKGYEEVRRSTLQKLASYFNVTMEYLTNDDITIFSEPLAPEPDNIYHFDNIHPIRTKKFPLLGSIACGEPIFADEEHDLYVIAGVDINADFCLTCKGDSMINARILDGDIVFIREQAMVNNGEIAAVIIDDEATLKRVYYYPDEGKLMLQPANPAYSPLMYVGEELNDVRILGKAVAFQSDVR